ncbi:MAG: DUF6048 family protein [Cytophagales bacterium]|nr:DUF6048 family protein [Cytophagales bacterium]
MKNILGLNIIFSIWLAWPLMGQAVRFTQFRVGIDPLTALTFAIPKLDYRDFKFSYHNIEGSVELIGPYRLSLVNETGYTIQQQNVKNGTQVFMTEGLYNRFGFNFDLSDPHKSYEIDLGWRFGYAHPVEHGYFYQKDTYWNGEYVPLLERRSPVYIWPEILIDNKFKLSKKKNFTKNILFSVSFRLKFTPAQKEQEAYRTQYIPGFGMNQSFHPSFLFNLIYAIHFAGGAVHKAQHLQHHYDIIEKDHHIKKVKKREGSEDIDRD